MLGMGTIGFIYLLDIRHIAFASANFIQGLNDHRRTWYWFNHRVFLGVMLIGLTNLFVSFTPDDYCCTLKVRAVSASMETTRKIVMTHFLADQVIFGPKTNLLSGRARLDRAKKWDINQFCYVFTESYKIWKMKLS